MFLGAPEYSFVSLVSLGHIYVPLTLPGGMLSCSLHVWYENSRLTAPTKTESNLAVSWLTWEVVVILSTCTHGTLAHFRRSVPGNICNRTAYR